MVVSIPGLILHGVILFNCKSATKPISFLFLAVAPINNSSPTDAVAAADGFYLELTLISSCKIVGDSLDQM